jgi:hypothetical protein
MDKRQAGILDIYGQSYEFVTSTNLDVTVKDLLVSEFYVPLLHKLYLLATDLGSSAL